MGWAFGILTIVSGRNIGQRRARTFSLVVAGINCLWVPLGTALGVCTLIVLMRESVNKLYTEADATRGVHPA
jgi:Na+-driven multidrug efflux pump